MKGKAYQMPILVLSINFAGTLNLSTIVFYFAEI